MEKQLSGYINEYVCDADTNNQLHRHFTEMTETNPLLIDHRMYVEKHKLGFGDRAFHYMWYLIINHLVTLNSTARLLEIGVYKGQVISLWSLLAKHFNRTCDVMGITPLSGHEAPHNKFVFRLKYLLNKKFREDFNAGNFYDQEDYRKTIQSVFAHFNLDFGSVNLIRGLSSDQSVLSRVATEQFDVIYIDGDHARAAVETDIHNYAPKIVANGFLVMDDASYFLPGGENNSFWKGHKSVSEACEIIPGMGFKNVLNIGHNRVYQKIASQ
jgi:hypothetical protein